MTVRALVTAAGCALALRVAHDGSYWRTVFPALLVISIGMAGAEAPLTTAVLASAQPGLRASPRASTVPSPAPAAWSQPHCAALARPFDFAVLGSAAAAFAAAVSAFVWVGRSAPTGA